MLLYPALCDITTPTWHRVASGRKNGEGEACSLPKVSDLLFWTSARDGIREIKIQKEREREREIKG